MWCETPPGTAASAPISRPIARLPAMLTISVPPRERRAEHGQREAVDAVAQQRDRSRRRGTPAASSSIVDHQLFGVAGELADDQHDEAADDGADDRRGDGVGDPLDDRPRSGRTARRWCAATSWTAWGNFSSAEVLHARGAGSRRRPTASPRCRWSASDFSRPGTMRTRKRPTACAAALARCAMCRPMSSSLTMIATTP